MVSYVTAPQAAAVVVGEIEKMGLRAIAIKADVSKEEEVVGLFQADYITGATLFLDGRVRLFPRICDRRLICLRPVERT